MTREEAIKWLKTFRGRYGMNELEDAVDVAIKALETHEERTETHACESEPCETHGERTAEPCWIPVSERLPEEYKRVIVSDVFGIYIGEFIDAEENWGGKNFINEHGMRSKSAKAWMPLPEPYRESEDKE